MAEFIEPPDREATLESFNDSPKDSSIESTLADVEHASKMLRRMSSGGPSTVRLRLLILVSEKPRMRKELASLLGVTQATLAGHLDKVLNMNLVKETRSREIVLDQSTILSTIEFLDRNLNLCLYEHLHGTSTNSNTQQKETPTNV